jgi:hypothetical protein
VTSSRRVTRLLILILAVPWLSAPAECRAQDGTVGQLKQLQELRQEVERKKAELRRELRLLRDVLGEEPQDELLELAGGVIGGMTGDELAAELRILREEIDRLRQTMARERLSAEDARYDVQGNTRTRLEWGDTDFDRGDGNVRQLLRTKVRITGTPRHDTRVVVEIQDSRLWGTEFNTFDASGDQVDFHLAYAELQEVFGKPVRLRLGRQELVYGSQRLMGRGNWGNTPRAYDALVLRLGESNWVDGFTAKLDEKGVRDRNLFGLWGNLSLAEGHEAGPYLLVEHDKNSGSERLLRLTGGTRFTGSRTGRTGHVFGYDLEGALQTGEAGFDDVFAWMGTATLRYDGPSWTKPEVRLGFDLYSGDADPGDGDQEAFNNLFAARHGFFGRMDLFKVFPDDNNDGGMMDIRLVGEMSASETVRVGLHLHNFTLVEDTVGDKTLGQEADVLVNWAYSDVTEYHWGGSIFVPGDGMKLRSGGEDPAFKTWMQLLVRF